MKRLTLILSLMIALVGLKANAAMYIVGTNPFGGWNPAQGMEMTLLDDGTYTVDATLVEADIWFIFAEQIGSWDIVNANRYDSGLNTDLTVTAGVEFTPVKGNTNKSFAFSGTVGEKYTFTFNPTTMVAKVDGYVAPITEFIYTVAGNNTAVFGTEWDVTNTDNDMTLDETDGLYKLVKNNVEIAAGTLYYKVARNHSWGTSWGNPNGPDGNQDYVFNENGTYNLTFMFDLENEIVSLNAELVQVGPEIDPYTGHLYIVGQVNDNNWNPSTAIEMTNAGDDDTFTLANAQIIDSGDGYGYFSFMSVLGESETMWPANAYRIGAAEDGTVAVMNEANAMGGFNTTGAFKIEPGYYNFNVVLTGGENGLLTITAGEAPEPTEDTYTVAGTENLFGSYWEATDETNDMTKGENGIYTWTKNNVVFEAVDTIEFKVVKNHAWAQSWPENNWWYEVATPGTYDFVITFNAETGEVTFTATKQGGAEEPELRGDVNKDNNVNITDVTALIDYLLSGNAANISTKNADCNLDSQINITDVTALIDYLLTGAWPQVKMVYTVVGAQSIFGSNWDPADTNNDMTEGADGVYTWTKENVTLYGNFEFKVVGNHDWSVYEWPVGYNNWVANVAEEGVYTIAITFNPDAEEADRITCTLTKTGDVDPIEHTYTVAGTENLFGSSWDATDVTNDMTKGADGVYTWTKENVEFTTTASIEFKVVQDHAWDYAWPSSNWWAEITEAGIYDFVITFDPSADDMNKITFTATKQQEVE